MTDDNTTTICPACGAEVPFAEARDEHGSAVWRLQEHQAKVSPGERCFADTVVPLAPNADGKAAPLPVEEARRLNDEQMEVRRRGIMWNGWNERTGQEYGWSKTHIIETRKGTITAGSKTLCGATVPANAELMDGADISTSPCQRCVKITGKTVVELRQELLVW